MSQLLQLTSLLAQSITWKEVAPVFYTHCGSCHRPGGIGPFNILDYSAASVYARGIQFVVERKEMPPWPADGGVISLSVGTPVSFFYNLKVYENPFSPSYQEAGKSKPSAFQQSGYFS